MLKQETVNIQHSLADYVRSGEPREISGAAQSRLKHYRRLVYNVVNGTIKQAFPITFRVLEEEAWENMVHQFFMNHDCQSPQVWRLPLEFYEYVREQEYAKQYDKAYLNDLLLFEWLEIEVHSMPDIQSPPFRDKGNMLTDHIALNPEHRLISLEYPVHMLKAEDAAAKKGKYFLLIFREPQTGKVRFINLSPLLAVLVSRISKEGATVENFLPEIAAQFGIGDLENFSGKVLNFLEDLKEQKMILGFLA